MPAKNEDLHGSVPDKSEVALVLIDMINDLEFDDGEKLLQHIQVVAKNIARFKKQAQQAGVPIIYVNDNYGRWQSDLNKLVTHCLETDVRGRPIVELLKPSEEDYFVLKPKHSGFFSTTLDVLLAYLEVKTLVLTGVAGNICVLFTSNDAYMRDFNLVIPADCVASNQKSDNDYALEQMKSVLKADIRPSTELNWQELKKPKPPESPKPQAQSPEFAHPID